MAQLYVRDLAGSVTRPVLELKGFQKVLLEAGESRTLTFRLSPGDLAFWNADMEFTSEEGEYSVFVGSSSLDLLEASFTLK